MATSVTRFFASRGFARGLGAVGRFMITSGTVILLLVVYQIWGTNLETNKDQKVLKRQFSAALAHQKTLSATTPATTTTLPGDGTTPTTAAGTPATLPIKLASALPTVPAEGSPLGTISIPAIGLTDTIVQGTAVPDLKQGPGHYIQNPLPGQLGNAAIAGHRTTYGAPFHNIDKVKIGDPIVITTLQGTFTYLVTDQIVVNPNDSWVLESKPTAPSGPSPPSSPAMLTLTACHPKFSASKRIVTFAKLVGNPVAQLPNQQTITNHELKLAKAKDDKGGGAGTDTIDSLSDGPIVVFPGAWWGLGCIALWLLIRLLAWYGHKERRSTETAHGRKRNFPRWIPYVVGTPFALLMLYFFFEAFAYESFTHFLHLNI